MSALLRLSFYFALAFKFLEPTDPYLPYVVNYIMLYKIFLVFCVFILLLATLGVLTHSLKGHKVAVEKAVNRKLFYKVWDVFNCLCFLAIGILGIDWWAFILLVTVRLEYAVLKTFLKDKLKTL